MEEVRVAGKLGRRPPKNAPALRLGPLLTGVIPAHPAVDDNLAKLTNWQMLGNDQYGDCVSVTAANVRRLVSAVLGGHEVYWTLGEVLEFYKTQNPGFPAEDNGMDIQTALEYLVAHGGPDGVKAIAFAKVDHTNREEVKAAEAIFGYVWTGLEVQAANQQQFSQGRPWDYVPGSPIEGGHSVISGGYLGQASNDVRSITWAEEISFTDNFWDNLVEEAWVVIWPEHLGSAAFLAGVDMAALAADYEAVTGNVLPLPTPPAPIPEPPVPPTPPEPPVPVPSPFLVGPGVLAAMGRTGDAPLDDENYVVNSKGYTFKSETPGSKGDYIWWRSTGKVYLQGWGEV